MTYVTQADYENAYGADELVLLADRDGDGVADANVIASTIDRVAGIIDSYLRTRFSLPLAETPDLLRECGLKLLRYALAQDHASERMEKDNAQALKWLGEVRDGKMDLGLTPSGAAPESDTGGPQIKGGANVFDRDALDAWSGDGP